MISFHCKFIYGGINFHNNQDNGDVFVLTLPGFTWFRAPQGAGLSRFLHTCDAVGSRQLISIGGLDNGNRKFNYSDIYQSPDPFTQGIGIFDMTSMEWMPSYNANAAPYESPSVVKDWYAEGFVDLSIRLYVVWVLKRAMQESSIRELAVHGNCKDVHQRYPR